MSGNVIDLPMTASKPVPDHHGLPAQPGGAMRLAQPLLLWLVASSPLQVIDPPIGFAAVEGGVERFRSFGGQDAQPLGLIGCHGLAGLATLPRMSGAGICIGAVRLASDRLGVALGGGGFVAMRGVRADAAALAVQIVAVDVAGVPAHGRAPPVSCPSQTSQPLPCCIGQDS